MHITKIHFEKGILVCILHFGTFFFQLYDRICSFLMYFTVFIHFVYDTTSSRAFKTKHWAHIFVSTLVYSSVNRKVPFCVFFFLSSRSISCFQVLAGGQWIWRSSAFPTGWENDQSSIGRGLSPHIVTSELGFWAKPAFLTWSRNVRLFIQSTFFC